MNLQQWYEDQHCDGVEAGHYDLISPLDSYQARLNGIRLTEIVRKAVCIHISGQADGITTGLPHTGPENGAKRVQ